MRRPRALLLVVVAAVVAVLVPTVAGATAGPPVHTSWALHVLPGVPASGLEDSAVDCPSVSFCAMTSAGGYATTLSGSTVSTVDVTQYGTDPNFEYGIVDVGCSAPGTCVASGESDQGPCCGSSSYRVDLSGNAWSADSTGHSAAAWHDVACNSTRCVDVGTAYEGVEIGGIADRATGRDWVVRKVVTPFDPDGNGYYTTINSVACSRAGGGCVAAGYGRPEGASAPRQLLFVRHGTVWRSTFQALPAGSGRRAVGAQQLTCPDAGVCEGLGYWADASGVHVFLETSTRGTPSARTLNVPAGVVTGDVYSTQLSCPTTYSCAGTIAASGGAVLVRLQAGRWSFHRAHVPTGGRGGSAYVSDVACASSGQCVAVGQYRSATTYRPAIWTSSQGQWTVQDPGVPSGIHLGAGDDSRIEAVDCAGSPRCVIVGSAADRSFYGTGTFSA